MHPADSPLSKLARAARRAELPLDDAPPLGFSTRVLAQLTADSAALLWERLGWRSLAWAGVVLVGCLWWDASSAAPAEDDVFISELTATAFHP
jgi:hypothetical protein